MDQHPIPRQITTFEFKLIGFLTVKQFMYLVVFIPLAYVIFVLFPIPLLNILLASVAVLVGVALAFLPVNDRPLEVWIRNMIKRLTSPTQYLYFKQNPPIYFLKNLFFLQDPHRALTHIESQEKLAKYLATKAAAPPTNVKKQAINSLLQNPFSSPTPSSQSPVPITAETITSPNATPAPITPTINGEIKKPFFAGVIKNHKSIALPGILIYVKKDSNQALRLMKTNPHGVFATFNPLPPGEYLFEVKDPKNTYFFDTMKIKIESANPKPLEIFSKELL